MLPDARPLHPAVRQLPEMKAPAVDEFYFWGGAPLAKRALKAPHFLLLGQPMSGKTWSMRMLMKSAIAGNPGPRHRAVVFDPKREALPVLLGMGIPLDRIIVMHPFDARCSAWDIASDLSERASVTQFAKTLCPTPEGVKDPYWSQSAAEILAAVIHGLHARRGTSWGLWDVIQRTESPEAIRETLDWTAFGRKRNAFFLDQGADASRGILSTLLSNLGQFEDVALLWRDARTKVSLRDWCRSGSVLLLGMDPEHSEALSPINRAIFRKISEYVSSRTDEDPLDETWFFIDEARELGKLDGLRTLMNLSRSKGARVVLGAQDKHGLSAVYGKDVSLELLSSASNVGVLSLGCPETAEWASRFFGEYEVLETEVTESRRNRGPSDVWDDPDSVTTRRQRKMLKAVLPQQLLRLPLASPKNGICGVYTSDVLGIWRARIGPEEVEAYSSPKASIEGFCARPLELTGGPPTEVVDDSSAVPKKARFRKMPPPKTER